jgi:hypothetical protein
MATSTIGIEAVPVSNLTFYCPSQDGRWKSVTVCAIPSTIPPLITLEGEYDKYRTPRFPGLGLIHSPSTHLDPASTNRRSNKKARSGVFSPSHPLRHRGVRGWPAILGTRRYSGLYSVRQNFTPKAPPASLPPLDPIKGQVGDSTRGDDRQQKASHHPTVEDQHLKQSSLYSHFFSLRPGIGSLSHSL